MKPEISRLIPHARDRAVVWSAVSHFTIEPPEKFFSNMVNDVIREQYSDLTEHGGANSSTITYELKLLGRLGMVERLPTDPSFRVVWHVRTGQEHWDEAQPLLLEHLERMGDATKANS